MVAILPAIQCDHGTPMLDTCAQCECTHGEASMNDTRCCNQCCDDPDCANRCPDDYDPGEDIDDGFYPSPDEIGS